MQSKNPNPNDRNVSSVSCESSGVEDPPVVDANHEKARFNEDFAGNGFWRSILSEPKSYGAPRVFDLFTLLAVTFAFGLLFAFLRLIEPLLLDGFAQVAFSVAGFVTLTGIAQMVLFGGEHPRMASIAAGPIIWLFIGVMIAIQQPFAFRSAPTWILSLSCTCVFGAFIGYVCGGLVGGVFLVAAAFRKFVGWSASKSQGTDLMSQNDDAIWATENDVSKDASVEAAGVEDDDATDLQA